MVIMGSSISGLVFRSSKMFYFIIFADGEEIKQSAVTVK